MKKVFLGGTCNDSTWRDELIKKLKVDYFNPVVDDWTKEAQEEEIKQRKECDFVLYVLTPKMKGVYSIAEVVDDSNKRPKKTIFCLLQKDGDKKFETHELMSFKMLIKMIEENGATVLKNINEVAKYLNKHLQ